MVTDSQEYQIHTSQWNYWWKTTPLFLYFIYIYFLGRSYKGDSTVKWKSTDARCLWGKKMMPLYILIWYISHARTVRYISLQFVLITAECVRAVGFFLYSGYIHFVDSGSGHFIYWQRVHYWSSWCVLLSLVNKSHQQNSCGPFDLILTTGSLRVCFCCFSFSAKTQVLSVSFWGWM